MRIFCSFLSLSFLLSFFLGEVREGEEGLIHVIPVLFSQGINEQQSKAIVLKQTELQERINLDSLKWLHFYFSSLGDWLRERRANSLEGSFNDFFIFLFIDEVFLILRLSFQKKLIEYSLNLFSLFLDNIGNWEHHLKELLHVAEVIESSHREKNSQILSRTADLARKVNGLRLTSCKSAKDRSPFFSFLFISLSLSLSLSLPSPFQKKLRVLKFNLFLFLSQNFDVNYLGNGEDIV